MSDRCKSWIIFPQSLSLIYLSDPCLDIKKSKFRMFSYNKSQDGNEPISLEHPMTKDEVLFHDHLYKDDKSFRLGFYG